MSRIIIFDFNRTIYDPETRDFLPKAPLVLQTLRKQGFTLFLICKAKRSREGIINTLGIRRYFKKIRIVQEKHREHFAEFLSPETDLGGSFVVGDCIKEEITLGNELGLRTIWLRRGKFAGELPEHPGEQPTHAVPQLEDILQIIK